MAAAVVLAVSAGALASARPATATTIGVTFLQSGLVHVAASGERAELHLVNASAYSRSVKLEIVDQTGTTRVTQTTGVAANSQVTISLDPTKVTLVRGRILINQETGEPDIVVGQFLPSLEIVSTGDVQRTKVYVGEFSSWE